MLRQNSSNIEPDPNQHNASITDISGGAGGGVDIQQELDRLEDMVLTSPHIPLTRRTLVDEEQLLNQLDLIRLHLPVVFQEAKALVEQRQEIVFQAEQQAESIIQAAQAKAAQILNEMDIVRQAEVESQQILQQAQQECIAMQEQNLTEIDQMRRQAKQQLEEMRLRAIAEAEEIQQGADIYADNVLQNIEQQLVGMLRIIHNGRQQLHPPLPPESSGEARE